MKGKKEKTFADRLWDFRRENELTQEAAAKVLGVKKKTLESWEHGRYKPAGAMAGLLLKVMQGYREEEGE